MPVRRPLASRRRDHEVLIVQQYFYPDLSAVSQLLGDVLPRISDIGPYRFTVLCLNRARPVERARPSVLGPVRIHRLPSLERLGDGRFVLLLDMLLYHIMVFGYLLLTFRHAQVVSFTTPPLIGFTVSLAVMLRKRRLIHYIEDLYPELLLDSGLVRRPYIAKKLSLFNRVSFRVAERICVIGRYMRRKLHTNYRVPPHRIIEIQNWTEYVSFSPSALPVRPTFLYSGNLGFAHEFDLLLDFVRQFPDDDAVFGFVGAGRRYNAIKRKLTVERSSGIEFSGYVPRERHSDRLAQAHFFLLAQSPSTVGDILPSKFYSYLAAGRPIVYFGTRRSEIGEELLLHQTGFVVEVEEDVVAAAASIRDLLSDESAYLSMCRRAARRYEQIGGVDRAARQLQAELSESPHGSAE